MDAIVASLTANGVAERDIQTRHFNISPRYEYTEVVQNGIRTNKQVLVGYFVADLFRKLHVALMMRQQGAPDGQIAKHLRLWGPQQVAFTGFMRRLNSASAGRLFDRIVEFDRRSKSGFGTPLRNLECFCTAVADELN